MEIIIGLIWIVSIIIGVSIGSKKGEGCISFGMTFLLGPLWLPIVFLSKGNKTECPQCKEMINKEAQICPYCRSKVNLSVQSKPYHQPKPIKPLSQKKKKRNRIILAIALAILSILVIKYIYLLIIGF